MTIAVSHDHDLTPGNSCDGHAPGNGNGRVSNTVVGTAGDDVITGTDQNNERILGLQGNDTLFGGAGNDRLRGGAGNDMLDGGAGAECCEVARAMIRQLCGSVEAVNVNLATGMGSGGDAQGDRLINIENLIGSAGDDKLTGNEHDNTLEGGAGADVLDGGKGNDTASYARSTAGVIASLATGTGSGGDAQGDRLINIENLTGSAFNDMLTGDAGNNTLTGGDGDDTLIGGAGKDNLVGGTGSDTASYATAAATVTKGVATGVTVNLANASQNTGDAKGDTFTSIENLTGSAFADRLTGDANNNILQGGAGADVLNGGDGNDTASYADRSCQ